MVSWGLIKNSKRNFTPFTEPPRDIIWRNIKMKIVLVCHKIQEPNGNGPKHGLTYQRRCVSIRPPLLIRKQVKTWLFQTYHSWLDVCRCVLFVLDCYLVCSGLLSFMVQVALWWTVSFCHICCCLLGLSFTDIILILVCTVLYIITSRFLFKQVICRWIS